MRGFFLRPVSLGARHRRTNLTTRWNCWNLNATSNHCLRCPLLAILQCHGLQVTNGHPQPGQTVAVHNWATHLQTFIINKVNKGHVLHSGNRHMQHHPACLRMGEAHQNNWVSVVVYRPIDDVSQGTVSLYQMSFASSLRSNGRYAKLFSAAPRHLASFSSQQMFQMTQTARCHTRTDANGQDTAS